MMIQREQQLIRTAILALLVVLALVYLLVYSIYYRPVRHSSTALTGSDSPEIIESPTQRLINTVTQVTAGQKPTTKSGTITGETNQVVITKDTPTSSTSPTAINRGSSGISASDVGSQATLGAEKVLPDTTIVVDRTIADEIGVNYRYTLRDSKGIYYLNLGSSTQDLGALLQKKGGSTFALTTPTKILANQLFGSRVVYLNLPAYKEKLVLMVVTIGSERRLLQIPYDIYHKSKGYIAEKFI